jgi:hypothetical protein
VYTIDAWADSNKDHQRDEDEPTATATDAVFFGVDAASGTYGTSTDLTAHVFAGTTAAGGRTVTFFLFGQQVGVAVTDENGLARLTVALTGIDAGSYPSAVRASFAGDGSLPAGTAFAALSVAKATPQITWNPAMIQAGTAIGSAQLNATTPVAGTFAYSLAAGTVLDAGVHPIIADFTPADSVNYTSVTTFRDISANIWSQTSHPTAAAYLDARRTAVDPTRNRIYTGQYGGKLSVLDGRTHAVIKNVSADIWVPSAMTVDVERQRLLMVEGGYSWLHVHDADSLDEIERIQLDPRSGYGAVAMDGATGLTWAGNYYTLVAVNLEVPASDPSRVTTFPVCATAMVVNTRTSYVYAACPDGRFTVVDGNPSRATFGQTVASLQLRAGYLPSIAIDPRRGEVYVANTNPDDHPELYNEVAVIDADSLRPSFNTRIGTITLTNQPGPLPQFFQPVAIVANPVTGRVYVASADWFCYVSCQAVLNVFDGGTRNSLSLNYLPRQIGVETTNLSVNASTNTVYVNADLTLAIQDSSEESATTPSDNQVTPVTVALTSASLTFSDLTSGGTTSATPIDPAAANLSLPGQFSVDGSPAYEIHTTASYTGPITLCFASGVDDPDVFASLTILHGVNGAWVAEATTHDFDNRLLCATVSSLSPFAIARLTASYQLQPLFDVTKPLKGGAAAPIKMRVLSSAGANVSSPFVDVRAARLQLAATGATASLQDAGRANAGGYFRYDATIGGYIFNLNTKGLDAGTYVLSMRISGDATPRTVQFQVR